MKARTIALLVAAVMVVATTGIGSALAITHSYPGEFVTVLLTDYSVALTYHSAGNVSGAVGDHIIWYNGFKNRLPNTATVDVTQSTSPSGGLNAVPGGSITGLSIPHTGDYDLGIIDIPAEYVVVNSGSHTINAYHVWHYNGNSYTSPVNDRMAYY
ncbi:hypothetical protein Mtc_0728 [Methanocella conradii HZ254]|uniref:Uncharacterized protein n=1 Tax=Methanocella conradii (strain DSM 24694 / JCM 17849 / CGMCC 1.5162 / HZ254) TaxID=1041930 RepID=H8I8L6_METCZ|nr:hypothetical protein [Methanocella conradii]AFC99492.1 hypothetical protein Mtc_0728 [Methanocella conradii HZ254]MDI6898060.1 hypothetical protein [Methanocella conradii]